MQSYEVRQLREDLPLWQVCAVQDGKFVVIATCDSAEKAEALRELLDVADSQPANSLCVEWFKLVEFND